MSCGGGSDVEGPAYVSGKGEATNALMGIAGLQSERRDAHLTQRKHEIRRHARCTLVRATHPQCEVRGRTVDGRAAHLSRIVSARWLVCFTLTLALAAQTPLCVLLSVRASTRRTSCNRAVQAQADAPTDSHKRKREHTHDNRTQVIAAISLRRRQSLGSACLVQRCRTRRSALQKTAQASQTHGVRQRH